MDRSKKRSCDKKKRYRTECEAMERVGQVLESHHVRLHSYECDYCNGWHVGHDVDVSFKSWIATRISAIERHDLV